ncbi:MAG: glycosyl transferase family 1 [Planctomycetaceae bacterium]|nr:MAG: glycosyl transferase family 1 [Planctomycetaceae bacterium]
MTASMRVALLIPTLDRSGAEKQFVLLATRLPHHHIIPEVWVLTRSGPLAHALSDHQIPVTVLGKRWKSDPWTWWRLRSLILQRRPQILHTWLFAAHAYGRSCVATLPKLWRPSVIVSERCVDRWKRRWHHQVDRWLLPYTTCLVGNSQSVVTFYRDQGVPAEKLVVIPNGMELPPIVTEQQRRLAREQILNRVKWPSDSFLACYVGRLAAQKRVQDIIWAVETLRQIRPQLRLLIVGDGPERTRLESFARAVGCQQHVAFCGFQEDVSRYFMAADVFCLASSFEGQSNSLMEAMAWGCPVVVSNIPENLELVQEGRTGLTFPVTDAVMLMKQLRRLIDQPGLSNELATRARQHVAEHHAAADMVDAYLAVYRAAMTQHSVTVPSGRGIANCLCK